MEADYCMECGMLKLEGAPCDFCGYEEYEKEPDGIIICKKCKGIYWFKDELNKDLICDACVEAGA